jgi:hypothetical protein
MTGSRLYLNWLIQWNLANPNPWNAHTSF